jgi:DNA replicative helicase MCM subunit Mcm2 (Cdc46/Mcm family)
MVDKKYVALVEGAAKLRKEAHVQRKFVEEALELVEAGQKQVERYPGGHPSLKAIYDLAATLEASIKQS